VDAGDRGCHETCCTAAVRASRRAFQALLSMRKAFDGIKKFLILRKLRSSCLEGPTALIQQIVNFLTASTAGVPRVHQRFKNR
jgi:hypothetical protein